MIPHLPRCTKLTDPTRYACNCGADAQNATAAMLDAADPLATVPAEEQQRILAAADRAANAQPMIAPSVHRDTIRREVAAWHAAHPACAEGLPLFDGPPRSLYQPNGPDGSPEDCDPEPLAPAEEAEIIAAAPGQTPVGPAARITEEDLAEIEARTADPPLAGDGPALRRLAAEVRALRGERDATAEKGDVFEAMLRTREAEITRLRAELAARAVPAADASLEARAREARKAFGVGDPYEAFTEEWKERWRSVVRAVDASRPGLTEEQARAWERLAAAIAAASNVNVDERFPELRAAFAEYRASRGETGAAPTGLTRAMHDAQQRRSEPPDLGPGIGGAPIRVRPSAGRFDVPIVQAPPAGSWQAPRCDKGHVARPGAPCPICRRAELEAALHDPETAAGAAAILADMAPDPRATLHDGDPPKSGGNEQ